MAMRNYQTYMGPTDPNLRHSEIEGYQPVSRIGEVVINCFSAQSSTRTSTLEPRPSNPNPRPCTRTPSAGACEHAWAREWLTLAVAARSRQLRVHRAAG